MSERARQDPSHQLLSEAEDLFQSAEAELGAEAPQLLNLMMFLVQMRSRHEQRVDALALAERALALAQKNFPSVHPGVIAIKNDLGQRLRLSDPTRAKQLSSEAFEAALVQFGPGSPASAFYGAAFGDMLISMADYAAAEKPLLAATGFFDSQGDNAPKDVAVFSNLAVSFFAQNKRSNAQEAAGKAVAYAKKQGILYERFLAPRPDLLLAMMTFQKDDPEAVRKSQSILSTALQNLDVPFDRTLIALSGGVGPALFGPGFPDSQPFLEVAVALAFEDDRIPSEIDFDLLRILATPLSGEEKQEVLGEGFELALDTFDADHQITIAFKTDYAVSLLHARDLEQSRLLFLELREFALLNGDQDTLLTTLSNLATLELSSDRPIKEKASLASAYAWDAFEIAKEIYGRESPAIVFPARALVDALLLSERYEDANAILEQVLGNAAIALGIDNLTTSEVLGQKAVVLLRIGNPSEAEAFARSSLMIASEILEPENPILSFRKFSLLNALMLQGKYTAEARSLAAGLLSTLRQQLGENDAITMMAESFDILLEGTATDDIVASSARMKDLLNRANSELGVDHPAIPVFQETYAYFLVEIDPAAAIELFQVSQNRSRSGVGSETASTSLFTMAMMLDEGGLSTQAVPFYQKALSGMENAAPSERAKVQKLARFAAHLAVKDPGSIDLGSELQPFQIMQWAQERKAGAALRSAAVRFSEKDAKLTALLREKQDFESEMEAVEKRLVKAFSAGDSVSVIALQREKKRARENLVSVVEKLETHGSGTGHITQSTPLSSQEVSALLEPGEALLYLTPTEWDENKVALPGLAFLIRWDGVQHAAALDPNLIHSTGISAMRCNIVPGVGTCKSGGGTVSGNVQRSAEALEESADGFNFDLAHNLYMDLVYPIEEGLEGVDHLLVVAGDETLASIPLQVLLKHPVDPDWTQSDALRKADWFIRQVAISNLPSVSSLSTLRQADVRESDGQQTFLGVGDPVIGDPVDLDCRNLRISGLNRSAPTLDTSSLSGGSANTESTDAAVAVVDAVRSLPRLADTRCELESVREYLGGGALLLGQEATETRIKNMNRTRELAKFKILSFATHGLVAGEAGAEESALVLTPPQFGTLQDDGLLTASEIATFDLDADIVILSACNTASGLQEGEEALSGLARAFFYAGARTLIVSHWPVDSDAAVRLSTNTFKALEQNEEIGPSKALRQAILEILDDPQSTERELNPKHWAPFVLVGSGG